MGGTYTYPRYAFAAVGEQGARHPVVVVGGGMVGLAVALDLAQRGQSVVVLDDDDTVSIGSRAICHAKRSLEIYGRLGVGPALLRKGVIWNVGKVFFHDRQVYAFDLLPEPGHEYPAFVNLQQYYLEEWLVDACRASGLVELRWKSRVAAVANRADGVALTVATPAGSYDLHADWLLACDGARSFVRESLGLPFVGKVFRDRFLIADVVMQAAFPAERWFWFDPPFHPGGSVLLHRQADNVWRIDFQLGWDADPEAEKDPERVAGRVRAMLGPDVEFTLEWISVYTFRCRRLEKFRHGRTIFLGDAAHQVSPFGARGGNGGTQDADNLAWKLAAVLQGAAPEALLDSYDAERIPAADENILNSTRSTDFITPKNHAARAYRDAALELAEHYAFARPLVNSGRLSRPAVLRESPLSTPDREDWLGGLPPGAPAVDAPVRRDGADDWLLHHLGGNAFTLLLFGRPGDFPAGVLAQLGQGRLPVRPVFVTAMAEEGALHDHQGLAAARYDARPGTAILLRPDQHVAARWRAFEAAAVAQARLAALGFAAADTQRMAG
ncbi:FAD-dependent oxidoreductase [Limobrevibacterium gyesilva]|uniref:FAD-dependent oxidoreductase n=1 Tax=Limobrevibacterium gyesilva TaxID=2991712 RepID=A0AA41YMB5_9PROT|nr:FAD-dependent oxidoreductase [Limobrevibacterium gyesilva]MCW3476534.1 FAD-dependent oxidoreductase [Limobrevibacterium gyesilva]